MYRAAIVGAGPSGFYAAAQLLASETPEFSVDLYDRLPTPFGLVRAGVAPDHPKIKSVTRAFTKTAGHERFRFHGHVEFGTDISRADLLANYHVVYYAIGSATDRRLGVPGEDLAGCHAATEFVAWYNGHPDHSQLEVDLHSDHAVVIGAGNVALDVARMLALSPAEVEQTDTADHAIESLAEAGVREVTILARRGPLQAAFTNPELLELGELERADVDVVDGRLDDLSREAFEDADKTRRRNVEIVDDYAGRDPGGKEMIIRLRFLASPVELLGDDDGHVRAVRVERNRIVRAEDGRLSAEGTGEHEELPAGLVVRSIGYRGEPIDDVPFDADRGVIRNDRGRVVNDDGEPAVGEYVSGWIKRGPSGVIGTNKKCAQETVSLILEDAEAGNLNQPTSDDITALMEERAPDLVRWEGWEAIDAVETDAGEPAGRPRIKLTEWADLRSAAAGSGER